MVRKFHLSAAILIAVFSMSGLAIAEQSSSDEAQHFAADTMQLAADDSQTGDSKGKKGKKGNKDEPSEIDQKFLGAEDLKNLFPDTEISHVNPVGGSDVRMIFHADGRLTGTSMRAKDLLVSPIVGDWSVTPRGTICFSTEQWGQQCFFLMRRNARQLIRYSSKKTPMPGIDWTIVKPGPRAHLVTE